MLKIFLFIGGLLSVFSEDPSCRAGCAAYYDGCNACGCGSIGIALCTFRLCENKTEGYCQRCMDGYTLNVDQSTSFGCSPTVGCGVNNCNSYYDGCNTCSCGGNGFQFCTLRACGIDEITEPYCTGCQDGYELSSNQTETFGCVLKDDGNMTTTAVEEEVGCTDGCSVYYDGCNTCNCGANGFAFCTRRYCETKEEPYCISCEKGYTLNADQSDDYGCENSTDITTTIAEPDVGCNNGCSSYFDGCNWCTCGDNGFAFCTLKFCQTREEPFCSTCQEGYQLINGKCEPIGCGNGCISYYDGCNSCGCRNDQPSFCTLRFCDVYDPPYCTGCDTGYELNLLGYCDPVIDNVTTTTAAPTDIGCDSGCASYFDGCNSCQCGGNGFAFCTLKYCLESADAYCTSCQDGYELANDGSCMESSTPTTTAGADIGCDSGCDVYNDGCNTCSCSDTGFAFCSLVFCVTYNDPYCISCKDGYTLTNTTSPTCVRTSPSASPTMAPTTNESTIASPTASPTDVSIVEPDDSAIIPNPSYILYASLFVYIFTYIL